MKTSGIMIAAVKSGSGKTTITCALLQALKNRKLKLSSYKCGPDYIDPMFHKKIIGVDSKNLDSFFSEEEQLRRLFLYGRDEEEISVVEGVMGLYDGMGGVDPEGSSYDLAKKLDLPIILVLDAHGMGRTMIPLLSGIMSYDEDNRIAGVILNRTSKMFFNTIAPIIEKELKLPVLGFFPKTNDIVLESRHLGLKLPEEVEDLKNNVERAADILEENVDIDAIIEISKKRGFDYEDVDTTLMEADLVIGNEPDKVRIAVAKDEAFCFYYEDNLRMIHEAGAEIVYFSPIHDKELPTDICGIILGGGYPELVAEKLANNTSMKKSIKKAIEAKMPSLAECGGFMYLHQQLVDENGDHYDMAGVIRGKCEFKGKLVRFGYVEIADKKTCFLQETTKIKAHEFHYYDSENNGEDCIAEKPSSGKKWECVHNGEEYWWGFPHLYYPSNPGFVEHFISQCQIFQSREKIRVDSECRE